MKHSQLLASISAAAVVALAASAASAIPVFGSGDAIISGPQDGLTCYNNTAGTFGGFDANGLPTGVAGGACVQITPHAAWKKGADANLFSDGPGEVGNDLDVDPVWISYANSGIGGNTLVTPLGNTNVLQPNMIVTQEFVLTSDGLASLRQWADDTVQVFIDGEAMDFAGNTPNFVQGTCAAGSPGCEPTESSFGQMFLTAGTHVFTWFVWQVGTDTNVNSNPFGLLYIGQVDSVPEPAALALLGLGVLGLGAARRRRQTV